MRPPFKKLLQTCAVMSGAVALVVSSAGYAGATQPDRAPVVTEDNDTNDDSTPNNVADDGDNAHPSGKDRSIEHGGSGNQGNAQSDPDDDGRGPDRSNGGADVPDGPGGTDQADQDGNNGCGNDDDFEDDNEGLCLGRDGAPGQQDDDVDEEEDVEEEDTIVEDDGDDDGAIDDEVLGGNTGTGTDTSTDVDDGVETPGTEVEGDVVVNPAVPAVPAQPTVSPATPANPATPAVLASTATPAPQVLGSQVTRSTGALAATGDGTTDLVPFGIGLALLGFGIQRSSKRFGAARIG